jgi:hypothetical protein
VNRDIRIELPFSEQHHSTPVIDRGLIPQIHENLGEETGVDFVFTIEIALSFDENDRTFGRSRLQDAIGTEAGLLDLIAAEGIGRSGGFFPE